MYTPILRNRQSELRALRESTSDVKSQCLPLLDLAAPPAEQAGNAAAYALRNIVRTARALQGFTSVLLDSSELDASLRLPDALHPLEVAAAALEIAGVGIIPVTGLHRDAAHWQAALRIHRTQQPSLLCMRLDATDIATAALSHRALIARLQRESVSTQDTIVLVDMQGLFGRDPDSLASQVLRLATLLQGIPWAGVIVAGYGIPDQITQAVAVRAQGYVPRVEQAVFDAVKTACSLENLWFGDYTTLSPTQIEIDWRVVSRTMSPRAVYALPNSWFIVRGGPFSTHDDGYGQYYAIASEVVALEQFPEAQYCYGDRYIYARSQRQPTPGNPSSWITACVNRHVALTSRLHAV